MRGSGRSFSLKEAARAQQVQAEIGRLLRQHYEASSWPMSDRLAEVIKKMEQPFPDRTGFQAREYPMTKPDEYRANAQEWHRWQGFPANPTKRPFGSRWRSSGSA